MMGKSAARAIAARRSCSSTRPVSAKPPDTTTAPPTPARTHSSTTAGTSSARTAITARSIRSGISVMLGKTLDS